jgi:hypothetical protein
MSVDDLSAKARSQEDDDLFKLRLAKLRGGSATASSSLNSPALETIDEAANGLVKTLADHLCRGQLTPTMTALLADYLSDFTTAQSLALFGLNKANRPTTKPGQETSAVSAFTDALRRGLDKTSALIEAYDAYFSTGPLSKGGKKRRTYAEDLKAREGTMASTIRPLLVRMGLLPRTGPGRKRKPN